jgi:hypothetical protein
MRQITLLSLALAGIAAMPAAAEQQRQDNEKPEQKIVCKRDAETGTRFKKKTCHSVAEWDVIAEENRRAAKELVGPVVNGARGN